MPRWCNLPNLLTLARLALVPFVLRAILQGHHWLAVILFAIAAVTDVLDGAAARRLGVTTKAGAYLDPIADKCLMSGVFLALAMARIVPWWFVAVVFGRDIYILLAVAIILIASKIREFPPSVWGKVSTFVQIVTAVTLLAQDVLQIPILNSLAAAMLWPCMGFTIWSGIHYTWRGVQLARAH
jgi:cardiolipin synthase